MMLISRCIEKTLNRTGCVHNKRVAYSFPHYIKRAVDFVYGKWSFRMIYVVSDCYINP